MNKNINWRQFADDHGLSSQEFSEEIIFVATAALSMKLDKIDADSLSVTVGGYKLTIEES